MAIHSSVLHGLWVGGSKKRNAMWEHLRESPPASQALVNPPWAAGHCRLSIPNQCALLIMMPLHPELQDTGDI